jgi:hypothetical protein
MTVVKATWLGRLGVVAAFTVAGPLVAGPAAADIVSPAGACVGSGAWKASGVTATSPQLATDDVIEVRRADEVSWSGRVVGPTAGTPRPVAGRVALRLPPPLGAISIADWSGPATAVERSGTYSYDLPSLVPAGVRLDLLASHDESGRRHCTASVGIIIPGGPFDSPLIFLALVGLALLGLLLALLGRSAGPAGKGRIVGGALLGLPFGLFLALTLVLFGAIALASPLVTVLVVLGAVIGALWTWWSPLGMSRPPAG